MDPKKLEERIAKLERELAFVKAQGLTRDEQDVLLNQESAGFFKKHSMGLIYLIIFVQFILIICLFLMNSGLLGSKDSQLQLLENQDENNSLPKRNQPFQLP